MLGIQGSGKTTVVHQIMNELPATEVGIISQDSYYRIGFPSLPFAVQPLLFFSSRRMGYATFETLPLVERARRLSDALEGR